MAKIELNKIKFDGFIKEGQLLLNNPDRYKNFIKQFNDCDIILHIEKAKKQRSIRQNKYYWAIIIEMIAEEAGLSSEDEKYELHRWLMNRFLPREYTKIFDENVEKEQSSRELSTIEFNEYMDKVSIWASEFLNLTIPAPTEYNGS